MLTKNQRKYLETISESEIAVIKPWDHKTTEIANELMEKIKSATPDLDVLYTGASALGIPGQNDIDFNILSPTQDFNKYLLDLIKVLGQPQKVGEKNVRWEIVKDGYNIDVYLADADSRETREQKLVFMLLKDNPKLLEEYKDIKEASNGLPLREYMRRKYEFYNRIILPKDRDT